MQNIAMLDTKDVEHFWTADDSAVTALCMAITKTRYHVAEARGN